MADSITAYVDRLMQQQNALRGGPATTQPGFSAPTMSASPDMSAMQPRPQGPSLMPTPRSQAELAALRTGDAAAAPRMAQEMYNRDFQPGSGLLGLGQKFARSFKKDERLAGYEDQAIQGLSRARELEDMQAGRTRQDEVNEIMQQQGYDTNAARLDEVGQRQRNEATINAADTRNIRTTDASIYGTDQQGVRQNDQQSFLAGSENTRPYHDGKGGVVNVRREPATGATFTVDSSGARTPIDTSTLIPYTPPQTGSVPRAANLERAENVDLSAIDEQINASTMGRILSSPVFEQATGTFDPERFIGKNIPTDASGRAIQSLNIDMDAMKVTGVAPILGIMGVNPTDKDMEEALSTMVSSKDQPRAWIDYVRNKFAPRAREVALIRLASGESTREVTADEINAAYNALMRLADDSEARLYPDEVAEAAITEGFDPTQRVSDPTLLSFADRAARRAYIQSIRKNK
mgnify:CR=1 FL=1